MIQLIFLQNIKIDQGGQRFQIKSYVFFYIAYMKMKAFSAWELNTTLSIRKTSVNLNTEDKVQHNNGRVILIWNHEFSIY